MARLADILANISERAGESLSIEQLIQLWSRFVNEVEAGYTLGAYDYVEELFISDYLQEIIEQSDASSSQHVSSTVRPHDERFRFATVDSSRPFIAPANTQGFWWFRVPRRLSVALEAELRSEGTIT
ncbi:MAG: hypothetical protein M3Z54_03850 [Gemmatimonadota bacterium]|nr:hypothetical protein [Gemmatimonadota bacterium]